ncbi:hypothetical protein TNCV_4097831 [Trichonephila clavipes]|nr:hypothetical protein TNCV_4097831 [Trichonephila clavipes]
MIEGYQKFLTTFKQEKDEHGVHKQLQESLKETIAARDQLENPPGFIQSPLTPRPRHSPVVNDTFAKFFSLRKILGNLLFFTDLTIDQSRSTPFGVEQGG